MSAAENEPIEAGWDEGEIDDVCELLVERHGVEGAKRRAFEDASHLKRLYPEDSE